MGGQKFGRGIIEEVPGVGVLRMWGLTADKPADGEIGYAPSCQFQAIDGATLDLTLYINIGTAASCNFDPAICAS
jgi:hypothetical protein